MPALDPVVQELFRRLFMILDNPQDEQFKTGEDDHRLKSILTRAYENYLARYDGNPPEQEHNLFARTMFHSLGRYPKFSDEREMIRDLVNDLPNGIERVQERPYFWETSAFANADWSNADRLFNEQDVTATREEIMNQIRIALDPNFAMAYPGSEQYNLLDPDTKLKYDNYEKVALTMYDVMKEQSELRNILYPSIQPTTTQIDPIVTQMDSNVKNSDRSKYYATPHFSAIHPMGKQHFASLVKSGGYIDMMYDYDRVLGDTDASYYDYLMNYTSGKMPEWGAETSKSKANRLVDKYLSVEKEVPYTYDMALDPLPEPGTKSPQDQITDMVEKSNIFDNVNKTIRLLAMIDASTYDRVHRPGVMERNIKVLEHHARTKYPQDYNVAISSNADQIIPGAPAEASRIISTGLINDARKNNWTHSSISDFVNAK